MELDLKAQRLKDFGAPKKEYTGQTKPTVDQRTFLDTGSLNNLVSLDTIETYDDFWERLDTLFF